MVTLQSITGIRLASAQFLNDFHRMGRLSQIFVAFMLAVAVLVSATAQPAAALTKAVAAAMMPCCDEDCPENPACNAACTSMVRCTSVPIGFAPQDSQTSLCSTAVAVLTVPDPPNIFGDPDPDGLKRPPRA